MRSNTAWKLAYSSTSRRMRGRSAAAPGAERRQAAHGARREVEAVEVDLVRPVPPGQGAGEGAQQRRLAAPRRPVDEEMAVTRGLEDEGPLPLAARLVHQPQGRGHAVDRLRLGQLRERQHRGW